MTTHSLKEHNKAMEVLAAKWSEDDARLIAAAPELLAALKDLVRTSDGHPDSLAARRYARNVIAKAEDKP